MFVGGIGEDEYFYSLTFGEDSTIECLAVPRFDVYDIMCNISSGIFLRLWYRHFRLDYFPAT